MKLRLRRDPKLLRRHRPNGDSRASYIFGPGSTFIRILSYGVTTVGRLTEGVMDVMRRIVSVLMLVLVVVAVLATGASTARETDVDPANFVRTIDNRWYPLRPGTTFVFTGVSDGKRTRDVLTVRRQARTIQGVRCVVVKDNVYEDGKLSEATDDWFAQDKQGTVWYFGEATSTVNKAGKITSTKGSWEAGVDGAEAGIIMPAHPKVGQSFRQEYSKGKAEDHFAIESMSSHVGTPYVNSRHAMRTREWSPLEPGTVERKLYVRGVGLVADLGDNLVLVSVTRR
jgi:hypothetical protein